ncbi:toprim domain-containing protein [Amycolatopsis sp. NPDC003731]
MQRLSALQRDFLVTATKRYHAALPDSPAAEHLARRGLMAPSVAEAVAKFRLGYVADPLVGHEKFRGMLAIPYLRRGLGGEWTVVDIKFRCIEDHDCKTQGKHHKKYMATSGGRPRLFNTIALIDHDDEIVVTEGEIDAIVSTACGQPAVGAPGATAWKPHFNPPFQGYQTVYVAADGDTAGQGFAEKVLSELPSNARHCPMPDGEDVNSVVVKHGKAAYLERLGKGRKKGKE